MTFRPICSSSIVLSFWTCSYAIWIWCTTGGCCGKLWNGITKVCIGWMDRIIRLLPFQAQIFHQIRVINYCKLFILLELPHSKEIPPILDLNVLFQLKVPISQSQPIVPHHKSDNLIITACGVAEKQLLLISRSSNFRLFLTKIR